MRAILSYISLEWYWVLLITGVLFALGNALAHHYRNGSRHGGSILPYAALGYLAGIGLAAVWFLLAYIPHVGQSIQNIGIILGMAHLTLGVLGTLFGLFNHGKKGLRQGFKLFLGLFYLDESKYFQSVVFGILRHTWEIPQTLIGHALAQVRNVFSRVSRVEYFGGDTFAINENQTYQDGISLGNYLNINLWATIHEDFGRHIQHDPLLLHEYGHSIDSRIFGWLYLFVIGIPSLHSAMGKGNHNVYWTEKRANQKAKYYAEKQHDIHWQDFEDEYPTA